jgi:hypothetical protein
MKKQKNKVVLKNERKKTVLHFHVVRKTYQAPLAILARKKRHTGGFDAAQAALVFGALRELDFGHTRRSKKS